MLFLAYVAGGLAVLVFARALFAIESKVGVPPRIRTWMEPLASPGLALAGIIVSFPVGIILMLPFRYNTTAQTIIWGGCWGLVLVCVAFITARWWQPLYLASVTWVVGTVVGLFEQQEAINQPEGETAGDVLRAWILIALFVAAAASVGVFLRLAHIRMSQHSQEHPVRVPAHHP